SLLTLAGHLGLPVAKYDNPIGRAGLPSAPFAAAVAWPRRAPACRRRDGPAATEHPRGPPTGLGSAGPGHGGLPRHAVPTVLGLSGGDRNAGERQRDDRRVRAEPTARDYVDHAGGNRRD